MDFMATGFQHLGQTGQAVHGHPGAVGAAFARGTVARGGGFNEDLTGVQGAQLVHHAVVGGHYEFAGGQVVRGLQNARGRPHGIGQGHHLGGRFRVHQYLGPGVFLLQGGEFEGLEFVVHDAGTVPQHHVGTGFALNVATQVTVRRPQNFLPRGFQGPHNVQRTTGGHHPVGPRFHGGAGVGVDHHGAVWVGIAKSVERVNRTAQVKGALRLQVGHQHTLARRQNFGGFAHEAHAGHHQGAGGMVAAKARHFQGVADQATRSLSQILQIGMNVIVGHQHRIFFMQQPGGALNQGSALGRCWLGRYARPGVPGAAQTLPLGRRHFVFNIHLRGQNSSHHTS